MGKAVGLEKLHYPVNPNEAEVDIIFVHGLFGDRRHTWTFMTTNSSEQHTTTYIPEASPNQSKKYSRYSISKLFSRSSRKLREVESAPVLARENNAAVQAPQQTKKQIFWPQDLLPLKLPKSRIFTWGYDVDIDHPFGSASTATVFQHASNLLSDLTDVRMSWEEKQRPIIFIAHSLGGIVVKDALNQSRTATTHLKEILPATLGVCFLGTPHRGSPAAGLAETIYRVSALWGKSPNLKILQALKYDAETLDRIQVGFKQTLHTNDIQIRSFREAHLTHGVMIVDRFSSVIDHPMEIVSDIAANHRDMTKFGSVNDPGFTSIMTTLLRWRSLSNSDTEKHSRLLKQVREDCLQSLENTERRARIIQVEDPYQDTFSWLFDSDVGFTDWLKSWPPRPIFWIQGKPGKSTLMKYASTHNETRSLLDSTPATPWTLITFFFHDRGSAIQKTVDGLLQEILYQLLKAYPELVQFLVPIRIQAIGAKTRDRPVLKGKVMDIGQLAKLINPEDFAADNDDKKTRKAGRMWDPQEVEEGLSAVTAQSEVAMNVCIFIDALDEHNGNHRRLVQILERLTTNSGLVNIKLCLASRPEPIFQGIYSVHPGFAIHEYTEKDVKKFAFGKIESSLTSQQDEKELELLRQLSEDITLKASGVFIWVKLVVEELIEGVVDGNTVAQLQQVLSSIPHELQALYQRVIYRRKPEYALEFYIMIQIVLRSRTPQTLSSLMAATDLALFGELEMSTIGAMERRLASRSGGLLELANCKSAEKREDSGSTFSPSSQRRRNTTKAANYRPLPRENSKEFSFELTVQFLHQTVKSFFEIQENATAMFRSPEDIPTGNGWTYLLRYCVYIATKMPITEVEIYARNLLDLFPYAADLGVISGNGAADILDSLLVPAKCSDGLEMPGKVADKVDGLHVWEYFCMETNFPIYYDCFHISARQYDLIVFAAVHSLVQYVESKLRPSLPSTPHNRVPLLYAACSSALADVWAHESLEGNNAITMQSVKLILLLLENGADPNAVYCGITPLGFLIRSCSSADAGNLLAASWEVVFKCIELLLRYGADPNIPIGSLQHTAPLCFALLSPKNAVRLARLLLKNGANHKIRDKDGFYPLYYTIGCGNIDTTELLLEYGADPNDIGHGINVLDLASYKGDKVSGGLARSVKVMESLLENYRPVRESKPLPSDGNVDIKEEARLEAGDNADEILKPPTEYKMPLPQHSW